MNKSTLFKLPAGEYLLCKKGFWNTSIIGHVKLTKFKSSDGTFIYSLIPCGSTPFSTNSFCLSEDYVKDEHDHNIIYRQLRAWTTSSIGVSLHVEDFYLGDASLEIIGRYDKDTWKDKYKRCIVASKSNGKTRKYI